jgi:hypothetical protein
MNKGTIIIEDIDGTKKTIVDLEVESGVNRKTIHGRWHTMDKPLKLTAETRKRLLRTPSFAGKSPLELKITVMPGSRLMTITEILALPGCGIGRSSIAHRAKANGGVINEDDLYRVKKGDEKFGTLGTSYSRKIDDLPHIPSGDLCHLSDSGQNTGAGRGEIPHEEWVRFYGRPRAVSGGRIAF